MKTLKEVCVVPFLSSYLQHQLEAELIAYCSAILLLSSSSRDEQVAVSSFLMCHLFRQSSYFIDFAIPWKQDRSSSNETQHWRKMVEKKRQNFFVFIFKLRH